MNVTAVNERVKAVQKDRSTTSALSGGDYTFTLTSQYRLWEDVLRAIANGNTDDPQGVARAALKATEQ